MTTTYQTTVIGFGNHASIEIPEKNLAEIKGNKRAPLKITVNGHTYQSTATGVDGKCMVVFPTRDREASGTAAGDTITVKLELDSGYREVEIPKELLVQLKHQNLLAKFSQLSYFKRKEYCRQISEAKTDDTRIRRLDKLISEISKL